MKSIISRVFLCALLLITVSSCYSDKKLRNLIDQRKYDKAYAYARKHPDGGFLNGKNTVYDVAYAHVSDLILQGEYTIAKQIADETKVNFDNILQSKLQTIYETNGANSLFLAISRMHKPDPNDASYSNKDRVSEFNRELELLAGLMKEKDETDKMNKLLQDLIPTPYYKQVKNTKTGLFQSDMVIAKDKNGKDIILYDYSEVNRIRQEFGLSPLK